MKRFPIMALAGMLAASSGMAMDASGSLNGFKSKVLPVLVQVDAKGHVTDVSSSTKLAPRFDRLLRQNLDEMITAPATNKHGQPISSQFVMNLSFQVSPNEKSKKDDYLAHFAYVSATPVPNGSWYWVKINGHRLALANRDGFRRQRLHFDRPPNPYQSFPAPNYQRPSAPPVRNATRPESPVAHASPGRGR
jgi:hypothetical protein